MNTIKLNVAEESIDNLNKYYELFPNNGREIVKKWNGTSPELLHKDLQALVDDPNKILLLNNRRTEIGWVEEGTYELGVPPLNRPLSDECWIKYNMRPMLNLKPTQLIRILTSIDSNNKWYYELGSKLDNIMLFNHGYHDIIAFKLTKDLLIQQNHKSPMFEQVVMSNKQLRCAYDKLGKPYGSSYHLTSSQRNIEYFVTNPNEISLHNMLLDRTGFYQTILEQYTWEQLKMILDKKTHIIKYGLYRFVLHDNLYIEKILEEYSNMIHVDDRLIDEILSNDNNASRVVKSFLKHLNYDR